MGERVILPGNRFPERIPSLDEAYAWLDGRITAARRRGDVPEVDRLLDRRTVLPDVLKSMRTLGEPVP